MGASDIAPRPVRGQQEAASHAIHIAAEVVDLHMTVHTDTVAGQSTPSAPSTHTHAPPQAMPPLTPTSAEAGMPTPAPDDL